MIVVVMGVSGSGKSTVGALLAESLGCSFADADDFHSAENRDKMSRGIPLEDADRWPWLQTLRADMDAQRAQGLCRVYACSALRHAYREILGAGLPDVAFVHLHGSPELVAQRLAARKGHFSNPSLMESQFATLEAPEDAIVADIAQSPQDIVAQVLARLPGR